MVALLLALAFQEGSPNPARLAVGQTVEAEITDLDPGVHTAQLDAFLGAAPPVGRPFALHVDESGPYRIELRSYAFDAYLVLRDAVGAVLAEDDDGLIGVHARIQTELEAGREYSVEACALHGGRGAFEIALAAGHLPELSTAERARAEREEAERHAQAIERRYGPEHHETAAAVNELALLCFAQGDYAAARAPLERALAITEKVHGAGHPDTATSLNNLGVLLATLGDYSAARPLHERALAIREQALGPGDPAVAESLNNLAVLLNQMGEFDSSRPLHQRALAIREQALGPEAAETGESLFNLAAQLRDRGEYDAARPLYERALATWERALGPEHPNTAACLSNLAALLGDQGNYAAARPLHGRALAIREKVLGPQHPLTAQSLHNLAVVLDEQGDLAAARPLYERVIATWERILGREHPDTLLALNNLANLLLRAGDRDEALELFRRALDARERALGPDHPHTGASVHGLATLLFQQGELAAALPLYERALAIRERALGPDHPFTTGTLLDLAQTHIGLGETRAAWELLARDRERRGAYRWSMLASLSESERYAWLAQDLWEIETMLVLDDLLDDPAVDVAAYEGLLDWKGQAGRLLLSSHAILQADSPALVERAGELRACQQRLATLALERDVADPEQHAAALSELAGERNRLELELVRAWRADAQRSPTTLEDLRSALPARTAALDFYLHRAYSPEGRGLAPDVTSERYLSVWILRPDLELPLRLDLGAEAEFRWNGPPAPDGGELVAARGIGAIARDEPGRSLRELLWDPIAPHLAGIDTVFVSPDGALAGIPFEALALEDGSYLIEHLAFVYLQDMSQLVRLGGPPAIELDSLLAIGGVDFGARAELGPSSVPATSPTSELGGTVRAAWSPLPATTGESQAVFDAHARAFGERGLRLLLCGAEPTEERLARELPRYHVLHLATHGYFNPAGLPSLWSAAVEDAGRSRTGSEELAEPARLAGLHPGLLTGLVCAGASLSAAERADGYLTAEEISWLDLSEVELAVLSACDTGLGRERPGEGLAGLRRAFELAGARTVVSSLWSVPDQSTAELMQGFYANLFEKRMGRLEALRAAQLELLRRDRAEAGAVRPSSWAAFVLSGEWR